MRRTIVCASCGASLQVTESDAERALNCPGCRQRLSANARYVQATPEVKPAFVLPRRGMIVALMTLVLGGGGGFALWWNLRDKPPHPPPARVGLRLGMPPPGGLHLGEPALIDPDGLAGAALSLDLSAPLEVRLTDKETRAGPPFELLGKIPAHVASAFDAATGWLFVATRDGGLYWYDPQTWQMVGWCALEQPAYQMVVDAQRRLLYVACCSSEALKVGLLGDREEASGDVCVYDLSGAAKLVPGAPLAPSRRFPLDGQVVNLHLSPTGEQLLFLAECKTDVQLLRLDTREWKRDQHLSFKLAPPTALFLNADLSRAYVLAGARCLIVDLASWKVLDTVVIGSGVQSLLVDKLGRLYILEGRVHSVISVVDLANRKLLARWNMEIEGRPYFRLDRTGTHMYVATSAVTTGRLWRIDVSAPAIDSPKLTGHAISNRASLLRGGIQLLGTEPYVVTGSGHVFRDPPKKGGL